MGIHGLAQILQTTPLALTLEESVSCSESAKMWVYLWSHNILHVPYLVLFVITFPLRYRECLSTDRTAQSMGGGSGALSTVN